MKFQNFVSALTVLFGIVLFFGDNCNRHIIQKKADGRSGPDRPQHGTANNVAHTHHYHTTINTARRRAVITLLCSYSFTLMMSSNQTSSSKTGGSGARRSVNRWHRGSRAGRTAPRAGERRARAPLSVPLPSAFHALQSAPAARRRLLLAAYVQRITMRAGTSREAQAQALHSSSCP